MRAKTKTTACHCDGGPTFDRDHEFLDGTGFVCVGCDSNVYYVAEFAR